MALNLSAVFSCFICLGAIPVAGGQEESAAVHSQCRCWVIRGGARYRSESIDVRYSSNSDQKLLRAHLQRWADAVEKGLD